MVRHLALKSGIANWTYPLHELSDLKACVPLTEYLIQAGSQCLQSIANNNLLVFYDPGP